MAMRNLFESDAVAELKERMGRLQPDSVRQWGKMTPAQAMAHYATQMEMVLGRTFPPRSILGRIFGRRAKANILSEDPFPRNAPTDKYFLIMDQRDIDTERERVRTLLDRFIRGGPAVCTKHPHSFFGPMTPAEWARLMYRHLDHHLRQFRV
ncbi:MAG: DinB family protein [Silvibacterium sp.]